VADSEQRAYIGSFTSEGGAGITTASLDPDTGALSEVHRTSAVADPSFLALSADRGTLYAVSELPDQGAAVAFSLRDPDAPDLVGEPVAVGGAPTHLCLHHGHLITADYGTGSVSVVALNPDGTLDALRHVTRHQGHGPHPERQEGPHAHAVLPDPTGRLLLSVDLGTDSVRVCQLEADSGQLRVMREAALRPGSGPRHLTFHPHGHRAYVVDELGASVTALTWDGDELRALGEPSPVGAEGADHPSEVVISPDGRFAWVAVRGADTIVTLALDPEGERPKHTGSVSCGGSWPRHLTLDPAGRRLYAANQRSGDVTWFDIDPATGRLHRAGALPVPAASCVVFG
jgi:6-phosphogluconolactonase